MSLSVLSVPANSTEPETSSSTVAPAARRYRNLTKHSPATVRASRHRLDWSNKPALYRDYPGAETIPLPAPKRLAAPALDAIATRPAKTGARPFDLEQLSAVLFLSGGISGQRSSRRGDVRATAAAGGLYPNEIYVMSGPLPGLDAGLYHYDPKHARLSRLRAGDWRPNLAKAASDERVRRSPVTLVLTGILWRSAWKYRERAYRHLYWDGGMKLAHVLAAATAAGQPATVLTGFSDLDVDQLLGIDGLGEAAMALVPLGSAGGAKADGAGETRSEVAPLDVSPTALSPQPDDSPEALRYHVASRLSGAAAVKRHRAARVAAPTVPPGDESAIRLPPPAAARSDPSLDAVVRRRRSTRHFAQKPISGAELAAILMPSSSGVAADFLTQQPTLLETYVVVHAVEGIPPGAYHYRRRTPQLERLSEGNFRRVAGFLSLDQALARDASAVLYYLGDLEAILTAYGERGYRLAELEAGVTAGRAYLAAYAVGRGATGLTFYDDEVTRFFSPHAARLEPLLVVAVGVPAKRSGNRSSGAK